MSESTPTAKRRLEKPFADLLQAQERYARAGERFESARGARNEAIRAATAAGYTRRSIAQATGLTAGRIQQIVDQEA